MLGWFTTPKVDHPLAEAKESRRIIADLPKDPHKALGEILFWLDSVNSTEGFRVDRRLELIDELDLVARPLVRRFAQDYLQLRQQKFQEHRVWTVQADYWRLVGAGYLKCIEAFQADAPGSGALRQRIPALVCRTLGALGQRLKWLALRYGPVDPSVWDGLGRLYAFAESKGFADRSVPASESVAESTTARIEFLKALMLGAISTESLLPEQIDIAERSIAFFASDFLLDKTEAGQLTFVFDLAMRRAPARLIGGTVDPGPSLRYFGPGEAYREVEQLLEVLRAEGVLPKDVDMGADHDEQSVAEVWRHLLHHWSRTPPARGSERRPVNARLTIVPGFASLTGLLSASVADTLDMTLAALNPVESWVVENASDGGYGAVVPATGSDWLRVGAMIGLRVQGDAHWGIGVIRRTVRDGEQKRRVGIQRLSAHIVPVQISPLGASAPGNAVRENDMAVLLTARPDAHRHIRLMQAAATFSPGQSLAMHVQGQSFQLDPLQLDEGSEDYDIGTFKLARRLP